MSPPKSSRSRRGRPAVIVPVAVSASAAAPRRRKPQKKGRPQNALLSQFLASAQNPFQTVPPLLGYEAFQPTSQDVVWTRKVGASVGVAGGCFAAVLCPTNLTAGTAGALGVGAPSYIRLSFLANSGVALNAAGSTIPNAPKNIASLLTRSNTSRPITSAVRLTARYPMTDAPGRLYALNLLASDVTLGAMTAADLAELDAGSPMAYDATGVAQIQGNWRQSESADFGLSTTSVGWGSGDIVGKTVLVAVGWSAATVFDVDTITHIEYDSGALASGDSVESPSLSMCLPVEELARRIRSVPSALDKSMIRSCQMAALRPFLAQARSMSSASASPGVRIPHTVEAEQTAEAGSTTAGDYVNIARDNMPSAESLFRFGRAAGAAYFAHRARNAGFLIPR